MKNYHVIYYFKTQLFLILIFNLIFCINLFAKNNDEIIPKYALFDEVTCGDYTYKIVSHEIKQLDNKCNFQISILIKNNGFENNVIPKITLLDLASKKEIKPSEDMPILNANSMTTLNLTFTIEKSKKYVLKLCGDSDGILNEFICLDSNVNVLDLKNELIKASSLGDAKKIKELLKKGADPNTLNSKKETVLMLAALSGSYEAVKVLVESGANIRTLNLDDEHALFYAIRSKNYDVVKYLLEKGANTYNTNTRGKTPLIEAKNQGDEKIIELVRKYSDRGF